MDKHIELELDVVGLLYRVTPSTLKKIADDTPLAAELKREPENSHDPNAIAVHLKDEPYNFHIGYLRKETAAAWAQNMDDGLLDFSEAWLSSIDVEEGMGEILVKGAKRKSLQKKAI
jgi:DNA modification methylase